MTSITEAPALAPAPDSFAASPGDEHIVEKARKLIPLLREHAAQAEVDRRLTPDVEVALRDAGMFKLTVPREHGGHQLGMRSTLAVTSTLAEGCSSAAWVAMIIAGGNFVFSSFGAQARADVWEADPDAAVTGILVPGGSSRRVEGGYVINGKWGWNSGCRHAQWTLVPVPLDAGDGAEPKVGLMLVPYSDLTIEDTWFVAGMQGSGSETAVATEVFVPDHRIVKAAPLFAGELQPTDDAEWQRRLSVTLYSSVGLMGPQLGMARAIFEHIGKTLGKGKPVAYSSYSRSVDAPSYQLAYADAASLIDSAHLHLFRAADDMDRAARDGVFPNDLNRARVRMDVGVAATRLREAVDLLLNVGGAGSFAQVNPVSRIWRDLETASRHGHVNPELSRMIYARAILGLEPVAPF